MSFEGMFSRLADGLENAVTFSPGQDAARQMIDNGTRHSCLVGGTRSGKTFLIVRSILQTAMRAPHSRHAMLRFRANAARASLALDTLPAVARKCFPAITLDEHRQDGFFEMPNGSQIWIGGLDDKDRVEKILGQEYLTIFLNEASQIPYQSYLVAMTRLAQSVKGEQQRCLVDLNPVEKSHWTNQLFGEKRDPISKRPLPNPNDYQRAFLNPRDNAENLSSEYVASLAAMPERQRKRFYEGVYVAELEGALWRIDTIERCRVDRNEVPDLQRIVIAIDPAVSNGENSDETGIVAAGVGTDGHGYLLEDASGRYTPTEWAKKAVSLYRRYNADRIVAEVNQGGALVENTLRVIDPNIPYKAVHASRGKIIRAEPIAALYEQNKVHHAGVFTELEDQMCSFEPGHRGSPDRMDALVWAFTDLFVQPMACSGFFELMRREHEKFLAEEPPAEKIKTEFAAGSVEWMQQQNGAG